MLSDAMMRPLSLGRPAKYCQFGQIKKIFFFFSFIILILMKYNNILVISLRIKNKILFLYLAYSFW